MDSPVEGEVAATSDVWVKCIIHVKLILCTVILNVHTLTIIKFFTGLLTLRLSGCKSPVQFAGTYTMSMTW